MRLLIIFKCYNIQGNAGDFYNYYSTQYIQMPLDKINTRYVISGDKSCTFIYVVTVEKPNAKKIDLSR